MSNDEIQNPITQLDMKNAGHPHELLLINLIFNHVLLFIGTMGLVGPYPLLPLVVPVTSVGILSYIFLRAKRAQTSDTWFVNAHWQICAQRSRKFIFMLLGAGILLLLGWAGYAFLGMTKVKVLALFAVAILPVMVTILILVVLESDAMNQARKGTMPEWAAKRFATLARKTSN